MQTGSPGPPLSSGFHAQAWANNNFPCITFCSTKQRSLFVSVHKEFIRRLIAYTQSVYKYGTQQHSEFSFPGAERALHE